MTVFQLLLLFGLINHTPVTYGTYSYPTWAVGCGWIIAMSSIVPIPIVFATKLVNAKGSLFQVRYMMKLRVAMYYFEIRLII